MKFEVISAAPSLALLTQAELRAAIGLASGDTSQDTALAAFEKQATTLIIDECTISADGIHPPTLLSETIRDTFWITRPTDTIKLSRQFLSSVTSVTADGTTLTNGTDYIVDAESAIMTRIRDSWPSRWTCVQVVVNYVAGFSTIPDDLKAACTELVRTKWYAASRDPLVKMQWAEVSGVMAKKEEFWVGGVPQTGSAGPVPETVSGLLNRYRSYNV